MTSVAGLLILAAAFLFTNAESVKDDVLVFTVATEQTDGFQRYKLSAEEFGITPIALGFGQEWKGGDMKGPGGAWKINLLKNALQEHKSQNKIALFTDAYDVIFLRNLEDIVEKFKEIGAKVLFSAEAFVWPDVKLTDKYPVVKEGKRFLNSGMYVGYVDQLLELLEKENLEDEDDDQLFFTKAYLDEEFREKIGMKLDHKSEIFMNLHGAENEVEIVEKESKENPKYKLKNVITHTEPMLVHGNGPSKKTALNYIGNYLPNGWNPEDGCVSCKVGQFELSTKEEELPKVLLALFIEYPTPFLEEQLLKVASLQYPKSRIHLFVHNAAKYHIDHVETFLEAYTDQYLSVKKIIPDDATTEWAARNLALDQCLAKECDYLFVVDSIANLNNPHTLKLLIEQNRTVIAPIMVRPNKVWSNFWGELTKDGFYARSNDYMDIVHNEKRGLWVVPFINSVYLINAKLLKKYDRNTLKYSKDKLDPDMAFCAQLRELGVFMHATNRIDFGHLVNPESFDITRTEPDMYQIFDNQRDWEARYIHPDYPENFNIEKKPQQPCPDVYWFPIATKKFCKSLITMMEAFGKWSEGKNEDNRLEGGYEAVPTRDIHMSQVGWDRHWLFFLQQYVRPLQELVFLGYTHDPPRSLMNFVVRYKPDEQPSLRPHHDSSTYTINLALNEADVDYEGGGCRFIRYNCSVTKTKPGWLLMHPGRLTHYHEGLLVTKGIRYIMISFVDP
ncbi:procollagen-lysine,2-oxoglutarate 5-dioxygenase [Harmonia axyridis]|uniref:procollagen-lysine,2-oxoglutarate 5-dioxygenase n=1 Tax=Harmonia axyridis TaxID=115357 RepID=UPI001E275387|nr:procollagen-lysine,2-oxoglutarate 5-dioxygenase [Harmonia axyridis]